MIDFDEKKKQDEYREQLLSFVPSTAEEYLIKDLDLTKIALCEALDRNRELELELLEEKSVTKDEFQQELDRRNHILSITCYHKENNKTHLLLPDRIIELNSEELEIIFGKEIAYMIKNQDEGDEDDE